MKEKFRQMLIGPCACVWWDLLVFRTGCVELKMGSAKFPSSWKGKHLLHFCSTGLKH